MRVAKYLRHCLRRSKPAAGRPREAKGCADYRDYAHCAWPFKVPFSLNVGLFWTARWIMILSVFERSGRLPRGEPTFIA